MIQIPIIYEDEELVVVEKPVGVVSNRAQTVKTPTLQDWMEERYRISEHRAESDEERYFVERVGLVHRLDKDTGGVMVLAKTVGAFTELLRQFKEREIEKKYLALTHGLWQVKQGVIKLPVGRMRHNRKMMGVRDDGRTSETKYQVSKEYQDWTFPKNLNVKDKGYSGFSLVQFAPKTGRMHQIRVHAKHQGHPLVGDVVYAGRKRSREDRKWTERLMLQAVELTLTHPKTKKRVSYGGRRELEQIVKKYLRE